MDNENKIFSAEKEQAKQTIQSPSIGPEEIIHTNGTFSQASDGKKKTKPYSIHVSCLIWSVANILCCCTSVLGIISLISTIMAAEAKDEASHLQRIRRARILNIVSSVINGIIIVGTVIYYAAVIILVSRAYQ